VVITRRVFVDLSANRLTFRLQDKLALVTSDSIRGFHAANCDHLYLRILQPLFEKWEYANKLFAYNARTSVFVFTDIYVALCANAQLFIEAKNK
jgi:hypothetical protein